MLEPPPDAVRGLAAQAVANMADEGGLHRLAASAHVGSQRLLVTVAVLMRMLVREGCSCERNSGLVQDLELQPVRGAEPELLAMQHR